MAVLHEAGDDVERLADAEAAVAALRRPATERPDLLLAAAPVAPEGALADRVRDVGVPLVLVQ